MGETSAAIVIATSVSDEAISQMHREIWEIAASAFGLLAMTMKPLPLAGPSALL